MNIEVLTKYCTEKQVPEQIRNHLSALPPKDLEVIICLLQSLSPSSNTLRTLVDLLGDIQHRDKLSFSEILANASFDLILSSAGSYKDKQIKLKNSLTRIRFPEKFSIEDKLNLLSKQIKENYGLKIILPEELEGDQLQLSITFRNCENLNTYSEKLSELSRSTQIQEIFSILKGEK